MYIHCIYIFQGNDIHTMFLLLELETLQRLAMTLKTRHDAAILPASLFQILNKHLFKVINKTLEPKKIKVAIVLLPLLLTIVHWDSKMFFFAKLFIQPFIQDSYHKRGVKIMSGYRSCPTSLYQFIKITRPFFVIIKFRFL